MNLTGKCFIAMATCLLLASPVFCDTRDDLVTSAGNKADKGDFEGAIADCTKALSLNAKDAELYAYRADVKARKGDLDGAMADYDKSIELNPQGDAFYFGRGTVKQAQGHSDEAVADFTKAIRMSADCAEAYCSRGILKYNAGALQEALTDFRRGLAARPSPEYAEYTRFRIWLTRAKLNETDAATEELKKAMAVRTGQPGDWASNVGDFLTGKMNEADFLAAAKNANAWIQKEQLCEAYYYAASKHLILGDKKTAGDYFQKCVATDVKIFFEYTSAVAELKALKAQTQ